MMFIFDRNYNFIDFHAPETNEFNVSHEKILGKDILNVLPGKDSIQAIASIEEAFETGEMQSYETQFCKNNEIYYYEVRIIISDVDEALMIVRNITKHHQMEAGLRKAR